MNIENLPLTKFEMRYLTQILEKNAREKRTEYRATHIHSFKKTWLKDEYLNTDKLLAKLKTLKQGA